MKSVTLAAVSAALALAALVPAAAASTIPQLHERAKTGATVYFIRHGEKPDDDDATGLSAQGVQRAQCLRQVFGAGSAYGIGYILAQQPKSDGKRQRPLDTVQPLATDLGLTVDTSCDRDDEGCVKDAVKAYKGSGNILIWYAALCLLFLLFLSKHPLTAPAGNTRSSRRSPKSSAPTTSTTTRATAST